MLKLDKAEDVIRKLYKKCEGFKEWVDSLGYNEYHELLVDLAGSL